MSTSTGYHDPYDDGHEDPDDPRNFGDGWKTDAEPEPREKLAAIPPDVLLWYPTAVAKWVATELFFENTGKGWVEKYTKWYQIRPAAFLLNEAPLESLSMWGGWRLNSEALWAAVVGADADLGWVEPQETRAPVEPATEADVDAALARMDAERLPREKWAGAVLYGSGDPQDAFHATRDRIKAKTPIPCRCCGKFFRVERDQHLANCLDCRSAGRKRCHGCNEVFSPAHNRVRRCGSCLAIDAELKARRKHH